MISPSMASKPVEAIRLIKPSFLLRIGKPHMAAIAGEWHGALGLNGIEAAIGEPRPRATSPVG